VADLLKQRNKHLLLTFYYQKDNSNYIGKTLFSLRFAKKIQMKKIAVFTGLLFCCFAASAQTDLKKKIVDSTCACLSEMPNIANKSQEELQIAIGQCMMKKSLEDFMALAQERNIDLTDTEAMQKLGTEIGMDLVKADCKAMNAIMLKMAQGQVKGGTPDEEDKVLDVSGTVTNVVVSDFVYVTVLSGAKSTQLVWSDLVKGGNSYAKNLLSLKNKKHGFSYAEKEVYSTKSKAYITVKMITAIE